MTAPAAECGGRRFICGFLPCYAEGGFWSPGGLPFQPLDLSKQLLHKNGRGVIGSAVAALWPLELDGLPHLLRHQSGIVAPADLRRVAHQFGNLEERLSFLSQVAAEGVTVVQARPVEPGLLVGLTKILAEVVRVPSTTPGTGEEPWRPCVGFVLLEDGQEVLRDGNRAVTFGLGLPELPVDRSWRGRRSSWFSDPRLRA